MENQRFRGRGTARLHAKSSLLNAREEVKYKHKDCKPRKIQRAQPSNLLDHISHSTARSSITVHVSEWTADHPSVPVLLCYCPTEASTTSVTVLHAHS